jgi:hypothetical protein
VVVVVGCTESSKVVVTPTVVVAVGGPIVVTVDGTCVEVGAVRVVGAVLGATRVVVGATVVVGSGGRVVVVVLVDLGGIIVIGGTVIAIVLSMGPRELSMGPMATLFVVVTGASSALTEVPLIGMLNTVNIPKNKLVNKTTTTRLNKVSVH